MNRIALQLLKKMSGIDVDSLQAEFNRIQGENVKVTTQLKYALQELSATEKKVEKLQTDLDTLKNNKNTTHDSNTYINNSFSGAIHEQLIHAEDQISRLNVEVREWQERYNILKNKFDYQHEALKQVNSLLESATVETESNEEIITETKESEDALSILSESTEEPITDNKIDKEELDIKEIAESMNAVLDEDIPHMPQNVAVVKYLKGRIIELNEQVSTIATQTNSLQTQAAPFQEQTDSSLQPIHFNTPVSPKLDEQDHIEIIQTEQTILQQQETQTTKPEITEQQIQTEQPKDPEVSESSPTSQSTTQTLYIVSEEIDEQSHEIPTSELTLDAQKININNESFTISEIHPELCTAQSMQIEFQQLQEQFKYIRLTTRNNGQYLFSVKEFIISQQLFEWGIEGKDIVSNEHKFISHEEMLHIQGLNNLFLGKRIECHFDGDNSNHDEVSQALLISICSYHPIKVSYRGKNGIVSETNLYYISNLPNLQKYNLPYPKMFEQMMDEMPDLSQIAAYSSAHNEIKVFQSTQFISIEIFDVFYTNSEGIKYISEGISKARQAGLEELVKLFTFASPRWYKFK